MSKLRKLVTKIKVKDKQYEIYPTHYYRNI